MSDLDIPSLSSLRAAYAEAEIARDNDAKQNAVGQMRKYYGDKAADDTVFAMEMFKERNPRLP